MARITDQELIELKARTIQAIGSGAHLGNATNYILELIEEIQDLRKPKVSRTLVVGELDVQKGMLPETTSPPEKEAESPTPLVGKAPLQAEPWTKKNKKKPSSGI
jgi:hypothetical protein